MATPINTLRYNIADRLDRAGRRTALSIRRRMIQKHGIGPTTWHEWLKVKKEDSRDIPGTILRSLSIMLQVPMESLFNDKTDTDEQA